MGGPLSVLLVEDSPDDAELLRRELRRAGFDPEIVRVEEKAPLEEALARGRYDLVVCDYAMPRFDAQTALATVRARDPDVPFIVVSGTIGEETAVEMMRMGAQDYLLKGKLARLGPAVTRELRELRERVERRAAERARHEAEASFALIIERSPDLVIVHREGVVVYLNPTAVVKLGHKKADALVGETLAFLVVKDDKRAEEGATVEQRWRRRDGTTITVEVFRQQLTFHGEPATVLLARDMTERNRIATAMMEMDRMAAIGILAAGVGHEINNPLAYVLANLEYVSSEVDALVEELPAATRSRMHGRISDLSQALEDTAHGARRVRDIVQDLRTFSRAEEDKVAMVDVRQLLDSSLRMAAVEVRQRAVVERRYEDVPLVLANESRIGQVFLNLIVNAAHSMPEGAPTVSKIQLLTRAENDRVVVEVRDSGSGIGPDVLPFIFDPFFTTKPKGQGTGLGLPICQRIVRALGGEIDVKTELGVGTSFIVRLPAAEEREAEPKPAPAPRREPGMRRGRVLVVDDEPALGLALRRVLIGEHDVLVVTSAQVALDRLREESFDVILCDLLMPGMSGMDLHAELVRLGGEHAHRMIFLTGGAFTSRAREFLESVPNVRLEKPIGMEDLREAIDRSFRGQNP